MVVAKDAGLDDIIPRSDADLVCDETLFDAYPAYRQLRPQGPAVWLNKLDMFALPRFDDVQAALADEQSLASATGVMINERISVYMGPSLDTAIFVTCSAIMLRVTHPGQWDMENAAPLTARASRAKWIELHASERHINNVVSGFRSWDVTVH